MIEFEKIYRAPLFLIKKWMKLIAHSMLGAYYRCFGYRKFTVSIESVGYWGAFKAAYKVLRKR